MNPVTRVTRTEAQIVAEQQFCYERRLAGHDSLREIARLATERFGYPISHELVRTRISAESSARVEDAAAEAKQLAISRAEAQIQRLYQRLGVVDPGSELSLKVEDRLLHAEVHLAKLLGTYAAERIDITQAHTGSIDDEIAALARKLGLDDPTME